MESAFAPSPSETQAITAEHPVFVEHKHPNYVGVFALLTLFTIIEVSITYFPSLPQVPLLLLFALLKGSTIALFYMHLRYDSRLFSGFFLVGLILAASMLLTLMALFLAHPRLPYVQSEQQAAATATPAAGTTLSTSGR